MSSEFKKATKAHAKDIASKMDQHCLAFFGSEEAMRAHGHLYVIEQTPMTIETFAQPELSGDYFKMRIETKYRIRPKTLVELEADEND